MSTQDNKDQQEWRASLLEGQTRIRIEINKVAAVIVAALLTYLVSTYSVPVAIGIAAIGFAYEAMNYGLGWEPDVSVRQYRAEHVWRICMLLGQRIIRSEINKVAAVLIAALLIYLISTYSVPVAIGMAAMVFAYLLSDGLRQRRRLYAELAKLKTDGELDL